MIRVEGKPSTIDSKRRRRRTEVLREEEERTEVLRNPEEDRTKQATRGTGIPSDVNPSQLPANTTLPKRQNLPIPKPRKNDVKRNRYFDSYF